MEKNPSYNQLYNQIIQILPNAIFDEVDGEIVISTGLAQKSQDSNEPLSDVPDRD